MLNQTKIANRNFKRSQRKKKRLAVRNKNESFEQYDNRKRREHQANHRRKNYAVEAE